MTVPVQSSNSSSNAYAQKLVATPDLDAERARAERMLAEAKAEAERNAKKAAEMKAIAERRLQQIAREQELRAKQASGGLPPAVQKQREADAAAYRARVLEHSRLETVKQDYAKGLSGMTGKEKLAEQKAEHERLTDAHHAVTVAREHLKDAKTPQQRAAAAQVLSSAERTLRTEYAKAAAVDNVAPVNLDHKALHDYADSLKGKSVDQLNAARKGVEADMTGAIHGSYAARAMDKVKLAIIDAAIKKAGGTPTVGKVDPLDKTRNPGNVIFDGPGAIVRDANTMSPEALAAKCKAAGVSWVSLQINNPGPVEGNIQALENGWMDRFKKAMEPTEAKVGFWGVSYGGGNAANDARTAAQLTAKYKGDFYVADCEGAFQQGQGDISENKAFVDAFQDEATKQGIGDIPRALSSMGRVALDMKPWIDNGWDAMPQAYWNAYDHYQPSKCVDFYAQSGWPKDRIHPTIATYDASAESGANAQPKTMGDYEADLKTTGTTGFSYYLPEDYLDDNGWNQLGQAISDLSPR